ncbi:hypothetical protein [Cryobacterium sp. PH31-L1]|uniref:hypothetical protein n=1 Tax=Cryobacterium sp. PH31-L1 TaxID=3046199 RepID=UPI0024B968BC|nr:hypothetical protein [Cryobacterium sp. PH31-L1]MDJ0376551.1 hypothetical protein [Cryobacterium sp. PH31-L1]
MPSWRKVISPTQRYQPQGSARSDDSTRQGTDGANRDNRDNRDNDIAPAGGFGRQLATVRGAARVGDGYPGASITQVPRHLEAPAGGRGLAGRPVDHKLEGSHWAFR